MVAAIAVSLLAQQSPTISFESPGIKLSTLCDELSKQSGQKIEARDEIRDDLLAIRLNAAPLDEVLKRIIFTERAKIELDGATQILRADPVVRAKLKADELAYRTKQARATQDRYRAELRTAPLTEAEAKSIADKLSGLQKRETELSEGDNQHASVNTWVEKQEQGLRLPTGNLMLHIFLSIPPEELAAIPPDSAVVWSTGPTPVERQCPVDLQTLVGTLATDSQTWADSVTHLTAHLTTMRGPETPDAANKIALVRFQLHAFRGYGFTIMCTGFDAQGKDILSVVTPTWSPDMIAETRGAVPAPRPSPPASVPIPPATAKMVRLWAGYPNRAELTSWLPDKEFTNMYFNPEKFNPVAETFGRVMVEVAKARNKQLVATEIGDFPTTLPDDCVAKGKLSVSMVEDNYEKNKSKPFEQVQYSADDSFITVRPGASELLSEFDIDCVPLGKLYRTARDNHRLTIMDVAHFAAGQEGEFGNYSLRGASFLPLAVPDLAGFQLLAGGDWLMKCFLGRLDEAQIAVAQRPEGLALAGCTPNQLMVLDKAFEPRRFSYRGSTDVWKSYSTDALPNGMPGGGVLHLSLENGDAVRARIGDPGEPVETRFFSPEQFAQRLVFKPGRERMNSYNLLGATPQLRQSVVFNFDFPEGIKSAAKIDDYSPEGKEVASVDLLPEPLRSEVKDAMQKDK